MNTKVRLSIVLSLIWLLSVIAYVSFDFISVPTSSCTYYIPELIGDAPMPAFELELERYKSFFLYCGDFTGFMYTRASNYSMNIFIVSHGLQLIEINLVRVLQVAIIPPIFIMILILSAKISINWVKNGKKYDK